MRCIGGIVFVLYCNVVVERYGLFKVADVCGFIYVERLRKFVEMAFHPPDYFVDFFIGVMFFVFHEAM